MANDRETYIQFGVDNKVTPNNIDRALRESGMAPLSKVEYQKIQDGTYGMNLLQTGLKQIGDIGGGLATVLGGVGEYLSNPEARAAMNETAKDYILEKGTSGTLYDLTNLMMSPYNDLSIPKLITQKPTETLSDIASGAVAHPVDASLDILGGLGVVNKAGRVTKRIAPLLDDTKVPSYLKSLVKGTRQAEVNSILNTSRIAPNSTIEGLNNLNFTIKNSSQEDLAKAIQNLEEGTLSGTAKQLELTSQLKTLGKEIDNLMVKAGRDPLTTRDTAYSQYITRQLQKDGKNIPVAEIQKYLDNLEYKIEGIDTARLKALKDEAALAYDSGLIFPVRHSTTATTKLEGFVDELTKQKSRVNEKIYGTQSYEDLAKGLKDKGYEDLISSLLKSERTLGAVEELNKSIGRKVNDLTNLTLKEDEVLISPTLLREKFGTALVKGNKLDDVIKELSRGINKDTRKYYADDLYIYNKDDIKALERAYTKQSNLTDGTLGRLTSQAKKTVLATPRYTAGNITTNIGMNLTEGAGPSYYIKALENIDNIPQTLKQSTTYSGYLEGGARANTKLKDTYTQLFKQLEEGTVLDKVNALSELMTSPLFKIAGNAEFLDRSANYIFQAEKYAKEVNKTVEEVLEAAKKNAGNNKTFRDLMERVNASLGDYIGRNYYLGNNITDTLGLLTPFYRPFTQGGRVFLHHAVENPIRNQFLNRVPARYGNEITQYGQDELNVTPDETYGGGFPVLPGYGRMPSRVVINPYHAYSALGELANNPTEALGGNVMGITPLLAAAGLNRYASEPTLPNQITINGRKVQLDNNGNEIETNELLQRLKLITAQSMQAYYAPVNIANQFLLPALAYMMGKDYRTPVDTSVLGTIGNTDIPVIMEGDTSRRARRGPETVLPQMGFQYRDTYPERKLKIRDRAKGVRLINRRTQRNERR